jgi:sialic acid synthase SpsE
MEIQVNSKTKFGPGHPPYILAEIGINHNGEYELAAKMIEEAARTGVNGVKFQRRTIEEMYKITYLNTPYTKEGSFGNTYGQHKKFLEFTKEQLLNLKIVADTNGVDFIVSGFDFSGFDFIENFLNPPFHKIASPLVSHIPLLEHVARFGKPLVVSTGMHDISEIENMMSKIHPLNNQIVLLQCTTAYPTEDRDVNLRVLELYKEKFNVLVGYSSHDKGVILPAASVAFGSCFIEKHFTLDRTMKGPDHIASVEPRGMELIVKYAKTIFEGLGSPIKGLTNAELPAKNKHGYSIVARVDLKVGDKITKDRITYKQPGTGLKPSEEHKILGGILNKSLLKDEDILLEHLK